MRRTTFGTSGRNFINLPQEIPGAGSYNPHPLGIIITPVPAYSIAKPPDIDPKEAAY